MSESMLESTGCALQEPFALQVLGPEMAPEFPDRCVVIVEPTDRCRPGMYVFAEVEGVRWFRQYRRDEQGHEWLQALDERFPPIALDGLEWKVLGVIIQRNIRRRITHYDYRTAEGAETAGSRTAASSASRAIDLTGRA